ncbi:hypothetical protein AK812_SmicGene14200 [Symbiodinium microadriaticum]|uniref:Uncharacterized protein n=1 Tax=Symbiodinium microadriaticum TaxID=2951 RepID=A0A1Q9E647_SYMMI|nr:hypothetical protein AK812_SmicGene14200 [Symbiodinium microadriaticum]
MPDKNADMWVDGAAVFVCTFLLLWLLSLLLLLWLWLWLWLLLLLLLSLVVVVVVVVVLDLDLDLDLDLLLLQPLLLKARAVVRVMSLPMLRKSEMYSRSRRVLKTKMRGRTSRPVHRVHSGSDELKLAYITCDRHDARVQNGRMVGEESGSNRCSFSASLLPRYNGTSANPDVRLLLGPPVWHLGQICHVRVWAGGHGHEHLAVVRVFSTDEVMLLNGSKMHWDTVVPCTTKSNMSAIDLILVYSKDLASNSMANEAGLGNRFVGYRGSRDFEQVVMDIVNGFQMKMDMDAQAIKSMSAMLNPEQDVYDSNGYTTNKHWVSGCPNHVFKNILDAMFKGAYMDMYDSFFLMEMDAVPIKSNWLDQFEMEAHEVHDNNQAVRGSQYLGSEGPALGSEFLTAGDKWDLFKHQMPVYLVDHINGNAIYNLKHPWTRYLYDTFTMVGDASMMEEMAFDVAFAPWQRERSQVLQGIAVLWQAMITMAAMSGDPMYSTNWTGDNMTYNTHTMLVGNYANTLLNTSYEFGTYIRHGSGKNLFENLDDDDVTLGVAYFDHQGHFMETVPTHHPFKKILGITYFNQPNSTQTIVAPDGNVTMMMQTAMYGPYYHLCEIAKLVDTEWFALTDNYHIVKAPVSVLMDESGEMKKPVLPYVLKDSKYCGERPNCKASMEQAEDLFSINLNYHHDKYEVLYKTADARMFCDAWDAATEGKSWGSSAAMERRAATTLDCALLRITLAVDVVMADDYIAWKISDPKYNIADEFTPKDKTRYGWRAWTSLWNPAPVDDRMCDTTLYGVKEYLETLGNISTCAVDYAPWPIYRAEMDKCWMTMSSRHVEKDTRPMFESGVCLLNPMSGAVYSVVETTVELTVADAQDFSRWE